MSTEPVTLEVVVSGALVPDGRLVLADTRFIAALTAVEKTISELQVTDAATAQQAATLQTRLNTAGKALEDERVKLTAPFLAKQREIMKASEGPADRIATAKRTLGTLLTAYALAEKKKADEAAADRQRQLDALEEKRLAEAEVERLRLKKIADDMEAKRIADAAAAAAAAAKMPAMLDVDFDDAPAAPQEPLPPPAPLPPTETEKAIAAIKYAPAVVAQLPKGVKTTTFLEYKVTNPDQLPDAFCVKTPKYAAIKTTFCDGWKEGQPIPECAGVTFTQATKTTPTGR